METSKVHTTSASNDVLVVEMLENKYAAGKVRMTPTNYDVPMPNMSDNGHEKIENT